MRIGVESLRPVSELTINRATSIIPWNSKSVCHNYGAPLNQFIKKPMGRRVQTNTHSNLADRSGGVCFVAYTTNTTIRVAVKLEQL